MFPLPSVTVQVTVVAPRGKLTGASFVVVATLQLSPVVGVPNVTLLSAVLQAPASTFTVTAVGAVIVGSIISTKYGQPSVLSGIPSLSESVSK